MRHLILLLIPFGVATEQEQEQELGLREICPALVSSVQTPSSLREYSSRIFLPSIFLPFLRIWRGGVSGQL